MSLTELFKASGQSINMAPSHWKQYAGAEFIKKVQSDVGSHYIAIHAYKGGATKGGTFAHWQIGLAYAQYLSPELASICNQIVKDFVDAKPEIAQSVVARTSKKGVAKIARLHQRP